MLIPFSAIVAAVGCRFLSAPRLGLDVSLSLSFSLGSRHTVVNTTLHSELSHERILCLVYLLVISLVFPAAIESKLNQADREGKMMTSVMAMTQIAFPLSLAHNE